MAGAASKVFYMLLLASFLAVALAAKANVPIPNSPGSTYSTSDDPSRITDPLDPAGIVSTMINEGRTTYVTQNGVEAKISGSLDPRLISIVENEQSHQGDWFIWNIITIDGTNISLTWSG